jgi:hypothetical protein
MSTIPSTFCTVLDSRNRCQFPGILAACNRYQTNIRISQRDREKKERQFYFYRQNQIQQEILFFVCGWSSVASGLIAARWLSECCRLHWSDGCWLKICVCGKMRKCCVKKKDSNWERHDDNDDDIMSRLWPSMNAVIAWRWEEKRERECRRLIGAKRRRLEWKYSQSSTVSWGTAGGK